MSTSLRQMVCKLVCVESVTHQGLAPVCSKPEASPEIQPMPSRSDLLT